MLQTRHKLGLLWSLSFTLARLAASLDCISLMTALFFCAPACQDLGLDPATLGLGVADT